ncbi:hypothetical protein V6N13_023707 [Hibiscus sabdariffa]
MPIRKSVMCRSTVTSMCSNDQEHDRDMDITNKILMNRSNRKLEEEVNGIGWQSKCHENQSRSIRAPGHLSPFSVRQHSGMVMAQGRT